MKGRPRVLILGGGMAGLAAAWRLSRPDGPGAEVTVCQRGFRLGGKGASSRGAHDRIEEHGLHVWPGHYDNAFRLMRECYYELDRRHLDPASPIQEFDDAFFPASTIGLVDGDDASPWLATFAENSLSPGEGDSSQGLPLEELLRRGIGLLGSLGGSLATTPTRPRAVLSTQPRPPVSGPGRGVSLGSLSALLDRRSVAFADLVATMLRGAAIDQVAMRGYASIDDVDFCEWLRRHGGSSAAVASPVVRGLYDLVFGYERGDRSRPSFSAGTGLHLATRMFFTYRGAIFWKMRAGMGDVVFAPLYEVLRRRGVRFEFFHRVDDLRVAEDGRTIARVVLGRQVALATRKSRSDRGQDTYDPLVRVKGLPVFADRPDLTQLAKATDKGIFGHDFESHWCRWPDDRRVVLSAGRDFDAVVLAIPVGMHRHICGELIKQNPRWEAMVDNLATVATRSSQVWLEDDERSIGWEGPASVVTGFGSPFDTFASMSHTLPFESWSGRRRPATAASFCGVLPESDEGTRPRRRDLEDVAERVWPTYHRSMTISRYDRVNTDPSDRYVQSLAGTERYRMRADDSGFGNLVLAGDWIDSGLNAGCIEAAVLGGLQAANAVEGRPLREGTLGYEPHGAGAARVAREREGVGR
jgi:uncharacterized protein with NAD-binding domain and iron-sulfur cluster